MEHQTVRLILRRLPTREVVADLLVTVCTQMVRAVQQEQGTVFEELGQTEQERVMLIEGLATSCYRQGLPGFPRRLLPVLISEPALQDLFVLILRQIPYAQIREQCLRFLQQRPEIPYAVSSSPTSGSVSEVPPDEGDGRRRTPGLRTRRDPRRTAQCDFRAVPGDDVPA